MKIFALAATALLATVAYAAPALVEARDSASVEVIFTGAAGQSFTQYFPPNNTVQKISNPLSVSNIHVVPAGFTCTFFGIDGSFTVVVGPGSKDVGPPQQQVAGQCRTT